MELNDLGRVNVRRCRICNQPIIATCDTTKGSKLMLFKTGRAADPITWHMMYPTVEEQDTLCHRCRYGNDPKVGKQSGPTIVPYDGIDGDYISN